jgi:hypothetical protein
VSLLEIDAAAKRHTPYEYALTYDAVQRRAGGCSGVESKKMNRLPQWGRGLFMTNRIWATANQRRLGNVSPMPEGFEVVSGAAAEYVNWSGWDGF